MKKSCEDLVEIFNINAIRNDYNTTINSFDDLLFTLEGDIDVVFKENSNDIIGFIENIYSVLNEEYTPKLFFKYPEDSSNREAVLNHFLNNFNSTGMKNFEIHLHHKDVVDMLSSCLRDLEVTKITDNYYICYKRIK